MISEPVYPLWISIYCQRAYQSLQKHNSQHCQSDQLQSRHYLLFAEPSAAKWQGTRPYKAQE